ncbi:MAG: hypothetical protein E4H45_00190 [Nitrospirales bacterium]|nr:MAG: hypothetical protein E4H45_00190 [Nitrospirales bacterium]
MKQYKNSMSRASFLRLLGCSTLGLFLPNSSESVSKSQSKDSNLENQFIDKLFSESLVFDGVGSLGIKRGLERVSFVPGDIKKLTGIDAGTQGVPTARLDEHNRWLEEHKDAFYRIDRASDIRTTQVTNRYGMLYYIQQGFEMNGIIESLAKWKEQGLRCLQITYGDNELGGGSRSNETPLSALGKNVIKEMNRLRMVVDISHTGKRTTLDVCQLSSAPVTANHANAERLTGHSRNKSDEEMKAIAETGGLVGVTTINRFIIQDHSRPATIDDFVDHVDYIVQMIGIDHVGIASDCGMDGTQRYEVDFSGPYLNSYERWKHVARRLHRKGYTETDLKKILGLNFKRVFAQILDP